MSRTLGWAAVAVTGLAVAFGLGPTSAAPALKDPKEAAWPGPDPAVYLGCGESGGPGTVVQLDLTGKVLGTVELAGTPYGLAADRRGLVAAIPGGAAPQVVRIGKGGKVETLLRDAAGLPAPLAVAANPSTGDVLVADNVADVLLLLPGGKAGDARRVLTIEGHKGHCQDMSVAFAADGHLLFGGTGPVGVYRFKGGDGAVFGDPVLAERGSVAAAPGAKRWAAALADGLRVYEGDREVAALAYPAGRRRWHDTLAAGPGGAFVIALHLGGTRYEVAQADLEKREFRTLFAWDKSRVVSLAVGPRMTWKAERGDMPR
jgi:hypothetical protein